MNKLYLKKLLVALSMAGVLATTAPVNQAHALLSSFNAHGRTLNIVLRVLGGTELVLGAKDIIRSGIGEYQEYPGEEYPGEEYPGEGYLGKKTDTEIVEIFRRLHMISLGSFYA